MNLIDLSVLSEKRRDILLLIGRKPGSFEEIESLLDITSASLRFHIKKLLDSGLLEEESGEYKLSSMAVPIIENLKELVDSLAFFEENMGYWMNHGLTPVPDFLLERLEELGRFELIEPDEEHMFEIPQAVMEYLSVSEEIFAFFSCMYTEIPPLYSEFAKKGLKLSLCVTEPIAERLLKDCPIETKILQEAENTRLFVCSRNVNLPVFVVTDRFMLIGFFQSNGGLSNQLIVCSGDGALHWGRELYRHYEEVSEPLQSRGLKTCQNPETA
ncbi:MAG: helix-turn-helix transcriptional regulator [Methanosarcina sp.]